MKTSDSDNELDSIIRISQWMQATNEFLKCSRKLTDMDIATVEMAMNALRKEADQC